MNPRPPTTHAAVSVTPLPLSPSRPLSLSPYPPPTHPLAVRAQSGGTTLSLRGAGFFRSDTILLRFCHEGGAQRLVRGSYVELAVPGQETPERIVRCEAPKFEQEGAGKVTISLSFDGTVFTSVPFEITYYAEPMLTAAEPTSAAVSGGTSVLLKAAAGTLFASPDAVAIIYAPDGSVLTTVAAEYDADYDAMRLTTPALSEQARAPTPTAAAFTITLPHHRHPHYSPLTTQPSPPPCPHRRRCRSWVRLVSSTWR